MVVDTPERRKDMQTQPEGQMTRSDRFTTILNWAAVLMMVGALAMVFLYAPRERTMGDVQRIFYFHLGSAWVGFFAFFVTMASGVHYLWRGEQRWDILGSASAEVGTVFMTMAIVSGSLWARPVWNTWWTWDPRLTISAVQWLLYLAYFMLRAGIEDPGRRARFAAVYGIIAFLTVPMSFLSIRIWRTIHPVVVAGSPNSGAEGAFSMTDAMRHTMFFSLAAFTVLYATLLRHRLRLAWAQEQAARLRQQVLNRL
jgi:heme exporter protein C